MTTNDGSTSRDNATPPAEHPSRASRRAAGAAVADKPALEIGERPRRRRRLTWLWWLIGIVLTSIVAGTAIAGIAAYSLYQSAQQVRVELTAAKDAMATIPSLARAQDTAGLDAAAAEIRHHTRTAVAETDKPLWAFVEGVPFIGHNIAAVRKTTRAANLLVDSAMPTAIQLLGTVDLDNLAVKDGKVDLAPYQAAVPLIPTLRTSVAEAQAEVADIERERLIPQVDDAIGELLDVLDQAAPALNEAERILPVALDVLGQGGERKYLLMFQNNAEVRALGGNPASLALMTVNNGAIDLPEQSNSFELSNNPVDLRLALPPEMLGLYEPDFARFLQNYTRTPDFPTAAQMTADLWDQRIGGTVDGVIAVDPVALGNLLRVVGPVTLADGVEMNGDNAAQVLLKDAYDKYGDLPSGFLDAYFASAAKAVFDRLSSGAGSPQDLLTALTAGIEDDRILLWMTRENEQAMVREINATGTFVADAPDKTQVGVFLNDASYSKLEYYLSSSIEVAADTCPSGEGDATVTTTVTLTSAVPPAGLSGYTLNSRGPRLGFGRETMILDVLYFAPQGAMVTNRSPEEGDVGNLDREGVEQGRNAESVAIAIEPGETRTVTFTSTLPRQGAGAANSQPTVDVRHTPLVTDTPVTVAQRACSG